MENFKTCTNCGTEWKNRSDFIYDPDLDIIGYQVHFKNLEKGFFLFNHSCKGTITIPVEEFSDMYKGPTFADNLHNTEKCNEFCLHENNLKPCPEECECSYVREVIQIIKKK